ncbi:TPA: DEAD/DEAH box helicase [Pseudomonas aeruginosa]|uniref:Helicase n=1 Tax=Ectopseudomonas oleovorans TaxID=301 RepID=A0A379JRZ9_ECTOL|nr:MULTISPECIES: DEAD/DEAH box helicase [Pseudomonadota]MBZ0077392.1 DEAD/DEAH box helicase [Bordetella hinzii]MBZ0079055.1 DEAD/DEAH box helicase [Bordetella hinzii]MBZ0086369.1 DEAD/DEAH box helicase [Bordetella hinzii]MCG3062005.1 DEAD/DEAH box helicase [Pseudomonas aeruginosa]MCG3080732.1 DEAD/DEAH box helicase [Pseudomonas aeruginosa]
MDNVFQFRDQLIERYGSFSRSFVRIAAPDIQAEVEHQYAQGRYWPEPLVQINPNYQRKGTVQNLAAQGVLHAACAEIFQVGKSEGSPEPLHLYKHQMEALAKGQERQSYVVTTGTGSGKSLSFFIPIIDRILKAKQSDGKARTRAIVIYPMNALANSQLEELDKFLHGYAPERRPFTVKRYTGQESKAERSAIADDPPDILLTNFMMLEYILTRFDEVDRRVVEHCEGLEFLVLDELHTYRGRQGADVALLVRRLRERLKAEQLVCIGTSATMSSTGSQADRNRVVADVASKLFGTQISEHDVIGETLERVTNPLKDVNAIRTELLAAVTRKQDIWADFDAFRNDPLSIWVELNLGIELPADEPPRRARPMTLEEASRRLAEDAGCQPEAARTALQRFLVAAHDVRTPQGRPPFAFKLHQFISGPGKVLTTLEERGKRHVTLDAQRFAPGRQQENVLLYPTHFCRDCGQEYLPVWHTQQPVSFSPREIDDIAAEDDASYGFLCPLVPGQQYGGLLEDLPETWIDLSRSEPKVKSAYKNAVPYMVTVDAKGQSGSGTEFWFIPGKFRFCLNCGTTHEAHGKDANRLSSLSGEGRSSATTMIALAALQQLFALSEPAPGQPDPRKLLGFTDNRQDAALQAGHFNDFIFLLTLRAGLIGALQGSGGQLDEEHLAESVFKALGFQGVDEATLVEYLRTPKLMGLARQEAQRTLRFIIAYRLLRDLRRGWRFNNPNLDQLGLLRIRYRDLDAFCADASIFAANSTLTKLTAVQRTVLFELLFDTLRRHLCLESRYLDPVEQDKARTSAHTYLNERWAFAPDEKLDTGRHLILGKRPEYKGKPRTDLVTGGPRSRLLRQIKTDKLWRDSACASEVIQWKDAEWVELIEYMLKAAGNYGYVQKHAIDSQLAGWRLNAAALDWCLIADQPQTDSNRINQYFRTLYLGIADLLRQPSHPLFDFEAQEHTAQVDAPRRQLLEQRFRYTEKDRQDWAQNPAHEAPLERLPVMFCSPTMELGVDISALNTVYLRNVPPTPANYAQRSGRAGRSGQQALVITYCAALSPHDQWFFHNAEQMVHGVVRAPTLDLSNRDLIDSHLQAVWLASTQVPLDDSIAPMLDLDQPGKPLKQPLHEALRAQAVQQRALASADRVINQLEGELEGSAWFTPDYVRQVIDNAAQAFSGALERWRVLFDATRQQMDMADRIVKSHTASHTERQNAQRRYGDAARQYAVLLKSGNGQNNDFYTYRYLASQGFLPGYNFPRLPLMAWIPARGGQTVNGKDDEGSMVSRPRFLALSEFGPRSLIYHQGRMYRVVRAKLNVGNTDHISGNSQLATIASLVCSQCGYGHLGEPGGEQPLVNRCENCDALLTEHDWVRELYRIETVETVATERISINDEERQRQGFELQTTYRFLPGPDGRIQQQKATIQQGEDVLGELTYAPAAQIWRINRGWRRRKDKEQLGFYINPITGTWSKQDAPDAEDDQGGDDALLEKVPNQRIVPFVEDHRNLLIFAPVHALPLEAMATLQAALKRGIEMTFQIEESELVVEPLPKSDERRALLFYEAAEGGAGVLTRLANHRDDLALVASNALQLIHHRKPQSGIWTLDDLPSLEQTDELGNHQCEAGCYQCLLSYFNQPDHEHINRRNADALKLLVALANAQVQPVTNSPATVAATTSEDELLDIWLSELRQAGARQPDAVNVPVNNGAAIAAAQYKASRALVFLSAVDEQTASVLQDKGWQVLDFSDASRWPQQFAAHADVFGSKE